MVKDITVRVPDHNEPGVHDGIATASGCGVDPVDTIAVAAAMQLKSPSATLPSCADAAWFESKIHVVASDVRKMHEEREWIRSVTGFPWPEEKPSVGDMPTIYATAMRYPAFSLFVQERFFGDRNSTKRGFPKAVFRRAIVDAMKRTAANPAPATAMGAESAPRRTLIMVDTIGREDLAILDLMSMPGRLAARALCHRVALGLQEVVDRGGAVGQAGSYVLEVVSPFTRFGAEMTVQEVFDRVIQPVTNLHHPGRQGSESSFELTTGRREHVRTDAGQEDSLDPTANAEAPLQTDDVPQDLSNVEEVNGRWSAETKLLHNVADEAATTGPNRATITKLRKTLATFTWLMDSSEALAPKTVATARLVERLRTLIASIEASLAELVGDDEEAAHLVAALNAAPVEVIVKSYVAAEQGDHQAETAFALAQDMAKRIEQNDRTYPRKKAHDLNQPLLIEQEGQLRASLNHIGISIAALKGAPRSSAPNPLPRPHLYPSRNSKLVPQPPPQPPRPALTGLTWMKPRSPMASQRFSTTRMKVSSLAWSTSPLSTKLRMSHLPHRRSPLNGRSPPHPTRFVSM